MEALILWNMSAGLMTLQLCDCVLGILSTLARPPTFTKVWVSEAPVSPLVPSEVWVSEAPVLPWSLWKAYLLLSSPQCRPSGEYQGQGEPGLQLQHGGVCGWPCLGGGLAFLFHFVFQNPSPSPHTL